MMNLEDRLTKAKIFLITNKDWAWFGQLSCYLTFYENDTVPTAAVDLNGNLYYNKKWFEELTDDNLRAVLCHEILHLAFRHLDRLSYRDQKLWNVACDLKVNEEIKGRADMMLTKGALIAEEYSNAWKVNVGKKSLRVTDINEKTSDQIYFELRKHLPKEFDYECDLIMPAGSKQEEEELKKKGFSPVGTDQASRLAKDWQGRVFSATQQSRGSSPAGVLREIYKLENSELPWGQILRQRFRRMAIQHKWEKPSKRYFPRFYFPGRTKANGIKVVAAIDTSGSMSQAQITKAISELYGLARAFQFLELWVTDCDAQVYEAKKVKAEDLSRLLLKGGGGTDFRPVFKWIKEKFDDRIDSLVFFTDCDGEFPKDKSQYETFWITDSVNAKIPFGRKLIVSQDN
jgi:predicted metal-dependent peptidase